MIEEGALTESLTVRAFGKPVYVPGNMISKYLFRYHCVRRTTLGSEILNICIYKFIQKSIRYQESFDYMIHNFGFILLIILVVIKNTFVWYIVAVLYILHIVNMLVASMLFGFPISRAKEFALFFPTKDNNSIRLQTSNDGLMNDFIEVRASSEVTYSRSDEQSIIFAKASASGSIVFMVYNQSYSTHYHYSLGYLNCWIQVFVAVFVLGLGNANGFYIYVSYPIWWIARNFASQSKPGIFECFLFPFYCICYIFSLSKNYIKRQFASNQVLEKSLQLSYLKGIENSNYW